MDNRIVRMPAAPHHAQNAECDTGTDAAIDDGKCIHNAINVWWTNSGGAAELCYDRKKAVANETLDR
jgi:hypothetical protein